LEDVYMNLRKLSSTVFLVMLPAMLWPLDLETVLEAAPHSFEVQAAKIAVTESLAKLEEGRYPGDVVYGVQPGVSVQTPSDGPFAEIIEFSGNLSIAIPTGLSETRTAALVQANRTVSETERAVSYATAQSYLDLYSLYQEVWIAQETLEVLRGAAAAAHGSYNSARFLFESGQISLMEYTSAGEELEQAEEAIVKGTLEQRLAWVELASIVGLDWRLPDTLEPALDTFGMLPKAQELITWAESHYPEIVDQQGRADAIAQELENLAPYDVSATIRTNLNVLAHSAVVSYSTDSRAVAASYSFPIATIGPEDTAPSNGSWSIGLTASIGLSAGKESSLGGDTLLVELEAAYQRLGAIKESTALQIRSKYQQYMIASDSVVAAHRAVERAQVTYDLLAANHQLKQLTDSELAEAMVQVDRAVLQLNVAVVNESKATLAVAHAAAYLDVYTQKER
jgi:outer membrane protein TolC